MQTQRLSVSNCLAFFHWLPSPKGFNLGNSTLNRIHSPSTYSYLRRPVLTAINEVLNGRTNDIVALWIFACMGRDFVYSTNIFLPYSLREKNTNPITSKIIFDEDIQTFGDY